MRASGFLSGGSPIIKRYQISATMATAGIPVTGVASTTGTGLVKATTTNIIGMVGLTVDTATYSTTQLGAGGGGGGGMGASGSSGGGVPASAAAYVGVIINPDILISARMSGGATSGTALTKYAVTTAQSGGLTISSTNLGSNSMAGGSAWFFDGANVGQVRALSGTWTNATSAVVVVPFDYGINVGDNAGVCPWQPFSSVADINAIQFTSDVTEADATIATGTGADLVCVVEIFVRDSANNGTTDSWVVWNPATNHQFYNSLT